MRILFCNFEYPPLGGGGGVINAQLAEELATRHEVVVLTSQGPGLSPESIERGVRILRVPVPLRRERAAATLASMLWYLPSGILQGRRLLRDTKFDVINTHFVLPTGPVGDALSAYGRVPNVLSVHGGDLYDPSKWTSPHRHLLLRRWIRRLLRRADQVVGQSRNTVENVNKYYASDVDVMRIPLGIKRPAEGPAARGQYGFSDNQILLATVGRLVARKAVDQLISMMRSLEPNTHLLILGGGPMQDRLQRLTREMGLAERVHFFGHVSEDDKYSVLRMSDLFVSSSQHEGFGLVFLEAMASGLPVVCYDYGGQTDFLEDGITGGLIPLNDWEKLIESCARLVRDADRRRKMSLENLNRVESYFIDYCAAQYEALFAQVIDQYHKGLKVGYAHRS